MNTVSTTAKLAVAAMTAAIVLGACTAMTGCTQLPPQTIEPGIYVFK